MRFNDSRRHNAILAAALRRDNDGSFGHNPRSLKEIWTAMENFTATKLKRDRFGHHLAELSNERFRGTQPDILFNSMS